MKNYIPLVLAVLLGLAAVLAVGRLLNQQKEVNEAVSRVVVVNRDLPKGDVIASDMLMPKTIPVRARPANAFDWSSRTLVVGQQSMRHITAGDYILESDLGLPDELSSLVGSGEWAVAVKITENGIFKMVNPGDEVAIMATMNVVSRHASADLRAAPVFSEEEMTMVLFPKVVVLAKGGDHSGNPMRIDGGEVILALSPPQAQFITAVQRRAELTLALRHKGDNTAVNRSEIGKIDQSSFGNLVNGVDSYMLELDTQTEMNIDSE